MGDPLLSFLNRPHLQRYRPLLLCLPPRACGLSGLNRIPPLAKSPQCKHTLHLETPPPQAGPELPPVGSRCRGRGEHNTPPHTLAAGPCGGPRELLPPCPTANLRRHTAGLGRERRWQRGEGGGGSAWEPAVRAWRDSLQLAAGGALAFTGR